jgi:hypothetical protein
MFPEVPSTSPFIKALRFHPLSVWRRVLLSLVAMLMFGLASVVEAAPGALKMLPLKISPDRKEAVVTVPAGYGMVSLQRLEQGSGWKRIAAKASHEGILKFPLPAAPKATKWRALGRLTVKDAKAGKFPASFLKGNNRFGPLKNRSSEGYFLNAPSMLGGDFGRSVTNDAATPPPGAEPVEADIWKIQGKTIYFFNQLRGLQVLDVSNPADPRLTASLRLPAVGQDLYLLPGAKAGEQTVVLLTRSQSRSGEERTRIQLVKVANGTAKVTGSRSVKGSLADSRMIGNRLILGTTEWRWSLVSDSSSTYLTEWILTPGEDPKSVSATKIEGVDPVIAAGADWLAVSVVPGNRWDVSDVTVFGIKPTGLVRLTARPIRTAGMVGDQFKLQWRNNVLTTISEKRSTETNWRPITVLENFRVWGPDIVVPAVFTGERPLMGSLELADGESLFATRLAGDKAYVVTFFQTDPLWIVNLTDPANPLVSGHLEVPGWSTHLEPIGDLLFSVGWESNTVAASLFDVADPAKPTLIRRINLGEAGSYSEAAWDEKAIKVIASEGLAMIPLTQYDRKTGISSSSVQLLDIDMDARDLRLRGAIQHEFDARRSSLLGDAVLSISQRVLVTAGIADRDAPEILAEVSLAWPVDRVIDAGTHLLQIESGTNYGSGRATLRLSAANNPEQVFGETDLGDGFVRSATLRGGKLFVLREKLRSQDYYFRSIPTVTGEMPDQIFLDVYDASALPVLTPLGSLTVELPKGLSVTAKGLLWPQPNRPAVVLDAVQQFNYWWARPMLHDPPALVLQDALAPRLSIMPFPQPDRFPYWRQKLAPQLLVMDVTDPAAPALVASPAIGTDETIPNGVIESADGLVLVGAGDWKNQLNGLSYPIGKAAQSVHVIEVPASGSPIVRPGIDLPGELFAVTDFDQRGFLAITRNYLSEEGAPAIKVSACDGYDAFEIGGLDESPDTPAAAVGRQLLFVKSGSIIRHRLNNDGTWSALPRVSIGWRPDVLRVVDNVIIGSNWRSLFAIDIHQVDTLKSWSFPTWGLDVQRISLAQDGDLLVPFGEYGAERLER